MPQLHALATSEGLLELTNNWRVDIHQAEVRLCLAILSGDQSTMETVARVLRAWEVTIDWEEDVLRRSRDLIELVTRSGMPGGLAELERRRGEVERLLR
jgi:hypothetical protein